MFITFWFVFRSEDVDTGEIEDNDDDSVNCRDEDTDENEDKDDDSVINSFTRDYLVVQRLVAMLNATAVPAKLYNSAELPSLLTPLHLPSRARTSFAVAAGIPSAERKY
ncbi:hypothetical protein Tco_1459849 [Tanacetum coccineum]